METYSEMVLLLFYPYRNEQDLYMEDSYTLKFRDAIKKGVFSETTFSFLQNLQDCKSNSFRSTLVDDDLQRHTVPLDVSEGNDIRDIEEEDDFDMEVQQLE